MSTDVENFEIENIVYINDELILRFFKVFSRAEYALKMSTDFRKTEKAEVDWDVYANHINDDFLEVQNSELSNAIKYLWDNPPMKQRVKDNQLTFVAFDIDSNQKKTQQLLLMVRTVRNNLFHGGKHTSDEAQVNDSARNEQLINASIVIIKACMKLNADVAQHYSK